MPQTDAPAWEDTEAIPTWDETRPLLSDAEMGQMAVKPPMQFLPGGMNEPGTREEKLQEAGAILGGVITAPGRAIDAVMPRWASEPLVNPQTAPSDLAFRKAHPVIGGVESAVVNLAKSFTSPIGIATLGMGALPGAAQRAVSLAFAGQMASSFPQLTDQIVQTYQQPDSPERTQELTRLFTEAAGTGAFTALATKHGLTPSEPILNRDQAMANRIAVKLSMPERLTISPQEQARLGLAVPEAAPPRFEDTSPIPEGGEMPQTPAVQFPVQEIKPTEVSNAGSIEPTTQVGLRGEGQEVGGGAPLRQQGTAANLPPQEGAVGRGGVGQAPEEKAPDLSKSASNVEKGAIIEAQDHRIAAENPAVAKEIAAEELKLDPEAYKGDEVKSVVSPPENRVKTGETEGGGAGKIGGVRQLTNEAKRRAMDAEEKSGRFLQRANQLKESGKSPDQYEPLYERSAHWLMVANDIRENPKSYATPPATSAGVETKQPTIEGGQGPLLAAEMVKAVNESAAQLRSRISNVKYGDAAKNEIRFDVDGKPHTAVLRGRNRDLILGSSPEADAAVAVRAILDGDSTWNPTPYQSSTQSPRSGTAAGAIKPSSLVEQEAGSPQPSPETKPPELMTPEEFQINELVKKSTRTDNGSPQFDITEWTRASKQEAEGLRGAFVFTPEGSNKTIIEFPPNTDPTSAASELVEALKLGDGSEWLPLQLLESIKLAAKQKRPFSADALRAFGFKEPKGYSLEGDRYVFKPKPGGGLSTLTAEELAKSAANNSLKAMAEANGVTFVEGDTPESLMAKINAKSAKAKEPFEMTAKEYSKFYYETPAGRERVGNFSGLAHKQFVREAIREGKIFEHPDYPDLTPSKQLTPLQKQWKAIKDNHPDEIVLVRLGDFYEAFYGDAKKLSEDAKVALTRRNEVPMAGVPYHAVGKYVSELQSKGHKVYLVEDYKSEAAKPSEPPPSPAGAGENAAEVRAKSAQTELEAADNAAGKASNEAEKAVVAWAKHVEDVVNPLKEKIRKIQSEVGQMQYDAQRTKPETKGKQHLTKKKFLEQYGVASMEEANALYKRKNAEWADLEKQLEAAESKRKELEAVKERRGKEWSSAATRAGELRRQVYPKVREGDVGQPSPPISQGPGARTFQPGAERPESIEGTGLKHAIDELERASYGFGDRPRQEKQAMAKAWIRAGERMAADPMAGQRLTDELASNPKRSLSGDESALILRHKVALENEINNAAEKSFTGSPEEKVSARISLAKATDSLKILLDAVNRRGSDWGREGRWRQALAYEDYSFATQERLATAAKGSPLTDSERAALHAELEAHKAAAAAYEKHLAEKDARIAELEVKAALDKIAQEPPRYSEKVLAHAEKFAKYMDKKGSDALARIRERAKQQGLFSGGLDPRDLDDLAIYGASKITRGLTEVAKWGAHMAEAVGDWIKPHLDEVWKAAQAKLDAELKNQVVFIKKTAGAETGEKVFKAVKDMTSPERQTDLKQKIGQRIKDNKVSEITPLVQKLAREFVASGVRGRDELIDAVHGVIREFLPDFTRRQAMDAISGYGDFKMLTKDEVSIALRDLKGQMQQVAKLEDMASGQAPIKTGIERRSPSDAERDLIKLVNEAKKKGGYEVTDPAIQLASAQSTRLTVLRNRIVDLQNEIASGKKLIKERSQPATSPEIVALEEQLKTVKDEHAKVFKTALEALKNRTAKRIADLEQKIVNEDFGPKPKKPAPELDREASELLAKKLRVEQRVEDARRSWELKRRTNLQKVTDFFTKWLRREFILSSPVSIAKLSAAAAEGLTFEPIKESVGFGVSKLFPRFGERAQAETASSVKIEANAFKQAFMRSMTDAAQTLKTGKSDLEVAFGGRRAVPEEMVSYFGRLHAALKTPLKRAQFERVFAKLSELAIRAGKDVTDPMVQMEMGNIAMREANRLLFLEDNRLVQAYQRALSRFSQVDKATGKVSTPDILVGGAMRFALPIVRIPTNLVARTVQAAVGFPVGAVKLAHAYAKGIESLPPEQADLIMRQLKQGSVGGAFLLFGYFYADQFGGYYQPEKERKPGLPKPTTIRIAGYEVPSFLLHHPLLEVMQLGATVRHVAESKRRKKDTEAQGLKAGVEEAALGLIEEAPFSREVVDLSKLMDPNQRDQYINSQIAGMTEPQALQWLARQLDKATPFSPFEDATRRKPVGLLQNLQMGIPGLRQRVPAVTNRVYSPYPPFPKLPPPPRLTKP